MQLDDKIITDSRDIQRYLTEAHAGKGDAEVDQNKMNSFLDCICAWDEYLFSYRRIPTFLGQALHNIRLVCQVDAVQQAIKDGVFDEVLRDGQTIRQAYVKKIAQTRALIDVGTGQETPELKRGIDENDKYISVTFSNKRRL